jgi:hypothetical protein
MTKISRRELLGALAVAAGGAGWICARRFLTTHTQAQEPFLIPQAYLPIVFHQYAPTPAPSNIYEEIRREALAPNSETNHPLPLVGSWNASTWWNYDKDTAGFYPGWQLEMVEQGHHLLPWFITPYPDPECEQGQFCRGYLESPIREAGQLNLPISFIGTQWEHYLYDDPAYYDLPPDQNPNVVALDGTIQKRISPLGPVNCWYRVGERWGSSPILQQVISWYPDPPQVIFVSNNEASKLRWPDAETDQHYIDLYGYGRDDDFKRNIFADGWTERYSALIQGFRDGLGNALWQAHAKFIAYEAFGPGWIGRWGGWKEYSLYIPNRIDPNPLFWQGGSPSLYICGRCNERDNNVQGALFFSMNWVFMLNEAYQLNPSFWYEFSSWDGDREAQDAYTELGQSLTPDRYGGFVQLAMWVIRPRVVRVYRSWEQGRSEILHWFTPVMNAVDRIYANPALQAFWRSSTVVANTTRHHPYQSSIPPEYSTVDRMFLLDTNLNPAEPWSLDTEFSVMSVARVKGTNPHRQWLLYAYAPLGSRANVQITMPEYRAVTVDVALEGSFYLVDESTGSIIPVTDR